MLSTGTLTRADLVEPLHQLLTQWRSERGVDGYYDIPLRSPYKAQVVSTELNRFGGGMGAYTDAFVNDVPEVPYINATPFTFEDDLDEFKYIGTMCPKINTFDHFWRMVWHKNTRVVVNLTHTDDRIGSERGDKREKYWPPYSTAPSQQELDKWPLEVSTTASNIADSMPGLILYDITLTHKASGEVRVVKLYWYSSWEDFGDSSAIYDASFRQNAMNALMLANEVNAEQLSAAPSTSSASSSSKAFATSATTNNHTTHNNTNNTSSSTMSNSYTKSTNDEWLIVHCSAGVGRTGTFITLLRTMHQLSSISTVQELGNAIVNCIVHLRKSRLWMVKTDGEFATIFTCFWHLFSMEDGKSLPRLSFVPMKEESTGEGHSVDNKKCEVGAYHNVAFQ